ncbi:MAG: CPXCG motif-containing cysteine-rich protein [Planctomycetes bacterium]|nr:CPXCG motif-containing cysteine-rich protein [Planctomycetota bacterium]
MDDAVEVICPYCGEPGTVSVDAAEEDAEFVQDCAVCCRPWTVRVRIRRDGSADVTVGADQ